MTALTAFTSDDLAERGRAFKPESIDAFEATRAWRDQSFTWITPLLSKQDLCYDVVSSWMSCVGPAMNHATSGQIVVQNMEVGEAYNHLFRLATDREYTSSLYPKSEAYVNLIIGTAFVLTTEHDNIIPPNAVKDLMAAIMSCPDCGEEVDGEEWLCRNGHHGFDVVSGLYFTKTEPGSPMAYGNPANGPDDFKPQSVRDAVAEKRVLEVNGIGMGCAIWRKPLFAKVSQPWFQTGEANTQDLYFCRKAKEEAGARFGVHCGVKVGHFCYKTRRRF